MDRRSVLNLATIAAVLAAVLPLAAIAFYAHHRAVALERAHLIEYGGWTLQRAERNLDLAKQVLQDLEEEDWPACTPAHVARMRQLTLDTRSVDQIGFAEAGRILCTSWGMLAEPVAISQPDTLLIDGHTLHLHSQPAGTTAAPQLGLARGAYVTWMRPERLVDVLTDTQMTLGIATRNGHLISASGPVEPALLDTLLHDGGFGETNDALYAATEDADFRAFAIASNTAVRDRLDDDLLLLIPLALGMSGILVGVVVWLSRLRLSTRKEIEIAIRRREFTALYQPIIDLRTGRYKGAEALLRWRRPSGEWISPNVFIPMAEQTGLIEPLTDLMMQRVATDMAPLLSADRSLHVAINLCPADIQSGRFLPVLEAARAPTGIEAHQSWLEATERGFMDADAARSTLEKARAIGYRIAIDDFGTGYSSLAMLESLPLDVLKIDKAFVDAIGTQAATRVVVPHVIEMAHGLKLQIVAEGVETEAQAAYLRTAGVDLAQGWLYARAMTAAELEIFCESQRE
ncbi:EAL domain-containing protein [Achromobacter sp. GG226]|uniref:EAL domain-containing protein n=1 Tax=Verticiella alkaliphila TaxID=2779529 RepID=UPI001C0CBA6F|nr:EAL domain-containing protein [Verticiella sp. GG226]MBU4609450.1 EAL domain-containing protein [Verticiella sp. GG226]